ncbi:hypothetical protein MMC30_003495 [Trapelia coarctata]|nr:hypothetical protein [Trapelia coarctata]
MRLQNSLVPLMLAMITLVLANPLAKPPGTDPKKLEKETINVANRQRLDSRQIPSFPFIDRFVKDRHEAQSADTISSSETPSQKNPNPKYTDVLTFHGPLIMPASQKDLSQLDGKGIRGFHFIDRFVKNRQAGRSAGSSSPGGTPSQNSASPGYTQVYTAHGPLIVPVGRKDSGQLERRVIPAFPFENRFVMDRYAPKSTTTVSPSETPSQRNTSPGCTQVYTANGPLIMPVGQKDSGQDATGSQPGSPGMPSSPQESYASPPSLAEMKAREDRREKMSRLNSPPGIALSRNQPGSPGMPSSPQESHASPRSLAEIEAHKDRMKKLSRLNSPPGTAMSWHFWTRRQALSDVEENDPSAFLAAHLANPSKVTNSVNSHQICGAGSVCNSFTIAGEGNTIHSTLPQGPRDLPHAPTDQLSRHYSSSVTPLASE